MTALIPHLESPITLDRLSFEAHLQTPVAGPFRSGAQSPWDAFLSRLSPVVARLCVCTSNRQFGGEDTDTTQKGLDLMSKRINFGTALAISVASIVASGTVAVAGHDHYVLTPNGKCHQVAQGQTAINDADHGGYHRFHVNVHVGATESTTHDDNLGDGRAAVAVYKAGRAPAVCDGD
jgi:hypothetical protein